MPLRSVEAATRDDAIAAAREQFGPSARVVGVRRVRSGGVLGFFATERYVAEVAPEQSARPGVPVSMPARSAAGSLPEGVLGDGASPEAFSSPLASAAQARARATAPARNGAAAWAAEARSAGPVRAAEPPRSSPARAVTPGRAASGPRAADPDALIDQARVNELVGLLTAAQPVDEPAPGLRRTTFPRASFPRADQVTPLDDDDDAVDDGPAVPASAAPSPFTAALARMVAGDRDVRQAVQEALEQPAATSSRGAADPWPTWPGSIGSADAVSSNTTRQKEETVGDQVNAPSSMTAAQPVEYPTWAAEPEVAAPADPTREEAIAEILRSALAQGHSDEALADILRRVLDGASSQSTLPEPAVTPVSPVAPAAPVAAAPPPAPAAEPTPTPVVEPSPVAEATHSLPVVESAPVAASAPVVESAPVAASAPVVASSPVVESPVVAPLTDAEPAWAASQAPLWGEIPSVTASVVATDAPIWAEVVLQEPAPSLARKAKAETAPAEPAPVADMALPEELAPAVETPAESVAETVEDAVAAGDVVENAVAAVEVEVEVVEAVEETLAAAEVEAAALAPALARTASDPAPMTMSHDATTVMPPLSLIPPLPGSRPRGLPPVPPSSSRPSVPSPRPSAAPSETTTAAAGTQIAAGAPAPRSLATVTRLPVPPLMASPEMPEMAELEEPLSSDAAPAPAQPVTRAARPVASPRTPREVLVRLDALGLPGDLLGPSFADDVVTYGTYAALTRALGLRLPEAPAVPDGAGEVLFVVGPGVETLRAARSLAASLRLDPDRVQWATRGDLAGLAPESSRMTTVDAAINRRHEASNALTATIVAVDAPLRTDVYWMAQMLAIWSPDAVWAVVEATRKPEDLLPWIDGLSRVDALIVQDTDLSADPAAVLRRVATPVALLDGVRATPHRWASLLCERLESATE